MNKCRILVCSDCDVRSRCFQSCFFLFNFFCRWPKLSECHFYENRYRSRYTWNYHSIPYAFFVCLLTGISSSLSRSTCETNTKDTPTTKSMKKMLSGSAQLCASLCKQRSVEQRCEKE